MTRSTCACACTPPNRICIQDWFYRRRLKDLSVKNYDRSGSEGPPSMDQVPTVEHIEGAQCAAPLPPTSLLLPGACPAPSP
jgi:hypothetical protein